MAKKDKTEKKVKKEKMEKKEKTPSNPIYKSMIIRCVAAVVCTAIVCGSTLVCTNKYADAIKTAVPAQTGSVVETVGGDVVADDTVVTDDSVTDDSTDAEDTADTVDDTQTAEDDSTATDDTAQGNTDSGKPAEGTKTTKPSANVSSKAQAIAKFNTAVNKVKSGSKSVKQNYCKNTQVSVPEIKNKTIKSLANTLINANMGTSKENQVYSTPAAKKANFPVENQTWSSKLTEADVKSASAKSANGVTTVTIQLIDDTKPNTTASTGHAGKAFSIVTKDKIVEGAGSAGMGFIKEESIGITFKNAKIVAQIDDKTGNLTHVNYYIEWRLALSTKVIPMDVAVSFGIEDDFTINW